MPNIVAGTFQLQEQALAAVAALKEAGFARQEVTSFFVNPRGQHDLYPVGGDADDSPGAHHAPKGAVGGAEAGGAVGLLGAAVALAALPAIGPAAALLGVGVSAGVGAYTGSLAGALSTLGDPADATTDLPPPRKSGMLVAVAVGGQPGEADAVRVLRAQGALEIEYAEGTIADGHWPDFDPLKPRSRVEAQTSDAAAATAR
jgi:hypothetical protein